MKKKGMILLLLAFILGGCNMENKSKTIETKEIKIELTQDEVKNIGDNKNLGANLLVQKAVEKEMENYKYSELEENVLKNTIEQVKKEYFLNNISSKKVIVTDEEVLKVYQENAEKLKNLKVEEALPLIKYQLTLAKTNVEKVKYLNSLVEKYNLNEKLKEYFPTEK